MSTLNVSFLGICTHIWNESAEPGAALLRRTICASARNSVRLPDRGVERLIPPHIPHLRVAAADIMGAVPPFLGQPSDGIYEWELDGVAFDVLDSVSGVTASPDWPEIANLGKLTPSIGPVNPPVVIAEDSKFSSMHFDTTGGVFSASRTELDALVARLSVETRSIDTATLSIRRYGEEAFLLILRSGSEITIFNDGAGTDTDFDFLLHYLCVKPFPLDPGIPSRDAIHALPVAAASYTWPLGFTVGPGCSNSTYP